MRVDEAWSGIATQLKRRHDLIPNLVETVKGYAGHEKGVLEKVTELRSRAMAARTPAQAAQAEGLLTQALRGLYAVAENYPDLKANQNFLSLQQALADTEGMIAGARQGYNAAVRDLNTRVESVPTNLIAGRLRLHAPRVLRARGPRRRARRSPGPVLSGRRRPRAGRVAGPVGE